MGASILKKLEPKGIVGLAYWDNGSSRSRPTRLIRSPADLKGKKLRIQSSKVPAEGNPQRRRPAPGDGLPEVHQALQTGVVDGTENPTQHVHPEDARGAEAPDRDRPRLPGLRVIANKKFWDGLPSDVRGNLKRR